MIYNDPRWALRPSRMVLGQLALKIMWLSVELTVNLRKREHGQRLYAHTALRPRQPFIDISRNFTMQRLGDRYMMLWDNLALEAPQLLLTQTNHQAVMVS